MTDSVREDILDENLSKNSETEKGDELREDIVEAEETAVSDEATDDSDVEPDDSEEFDSQPEEEYTSSSDYFDDDDFLAAEDRSLHSDQSAGVVQQLENVVSWEVEGFYKEDGKPRNRLVLRQDPPIFKITSSNGDYAEFILTKTLAQDFERIFGDVHNGFYGITPKSDRPSPFSQEGFRSNMEGAKEWVLDNKVKTLMILFVVFVVFGTPFLL